jgi:hypothetical protein
MSEQKRLHKSYRKYVVTLQADDGQGVRYYLYTSSADEAKMFACQAELAPQGAVVNVAGGDCEETAA